MREAQARDEEPKVVIERELSIAISLVVMRHSSPVIGAPSDLSTHCHLQCVDPREALLACDSVIRLMQDTKAKIQAPNLGLVKG